MSQYNSVSKIEKWFDSYLNFEKLPQKNIFWLETVKFFCEKLNNPQNSCPCFHIAGSKGKGSVSAMVSSILSEAGYKTGLYTSPHIIDFIERIGSANGCFEESAYQLAADELMNCVNSTPIEELPGQRPITWFELVTVYAFLVFRNAHTDFNVFEVGLGGRLDATNVVIPKISILTPIELEHTQFLGDTLEKIAGEKAGIIKKDIPVISANQKPEVKDVFVKKALELNTKVDFIQDLVSSCIFNYTDNSMKNNTPSQDFLNSKPLMNIQIKSALFKRPLNASLKLLGQIQAENAALAACAVKKVIPTLDEAIIEKGLEKAILPGRFEVIHHNLILDGAHTVNSIKYTLDTFNTLYKNSKAHLLFACAADKDMMDIAQLFGNRFEKITLTIPGNVKQSDFKKLTESFSNSGLLYEKNENYIEAIQKSIKSAQDENAVLLITGSFYLVAEVKKILANN